MSRSVAQFIADNLPGVTVEQAQAWIDKFEGDERDITGSYKFNGKLAIEFEGDKWFDIDELRGEILKANQGDTE